MFDLNVPFFCTKMSLNFILLCLIQFNLNSQISSAANVTRKFPNDFKFGSSTSAYQIEGAWNIDGRTPSIWDEAVHNRPEMIQDGSTGDIAADSYHNYKRDVEMLRELGLDFYRLSISWSRLLPDGYNDKINLKAVKFYNNYINELLKYNITPFITLYHWDLPQSLQDLGGFTNPLLANWFEDYAVVVFKLFGDRVKNWITFNEPQEICNYGYGADVFAPFLNVSGIGEYLCYRNLLLAHARVYKLYDGVFRKRQGGRVGITVSIPWYKPHSDSVEDHLATELRRQAMWKIIVDPIFSRHGGFPRELVQRVAEKSREQGYARSRLEGLTLAEAQYVRGTYDFMGINHYRCALISATQGLQAVPVPSMMDDTQCGEIKPEGWWYSAIGDFELPPKSFYNLLMELKSLYNTTIVVTENGIPSNYDFHDDEKVHYLRVQLENVLDALESGVKVEGYAVWSLMDNFEWIRGYTQYYGMYQVDFKDPKRTRRPRKSAFAVKHIINTRTIDNDYQADEKDVMTIDKGH